MKLELLKQADTILSKCGRPTLPGGITCVPLVKNIVVPMITTPNDSIVFTREIPGDTVWCLRAISSDQGMSGQSGVRIQVQFPNGRFLFGGNGQDLGLFAWVGSYRFLVDPEMDFDPGGKLKVTLTDTTGVARAVNLVFEGCYKYFLKGGVATTWPAVGSLASFLPKYRGDSNENILAPSWRAGAQPKVPDGYASNDHYTYASEVITFNLATGPLAGQLVIPIDEGYDFFARRLLVDLRLIGEPEPPVGIVLGRLRTGTGYSFNDDFIDLAKYLCGAEWAKGWKIRGRDSVFIDLQVADASVLGTLTYQVFLEGARRRKAT